jgi:hypothetical protein
MEYEDPEQDANNTENDFTKDDKRFAYRSELGYQDKENESDSYQHGFHQKHHCFCLIFTFTRQ